MFFKAWNQTFKQSESENTYTYISSCRRTDFYWIVRLIILCHQSIWCILLKKRENERDCSTMYGLGARLV